MFYLLEFYLAVCFSGEQHIQEATAEKETAVKSQKFYHVAWLSTFLFNKVDKQQDKVTDHVLLITTHTYC